MEDEEPTPLGEQQPQPSQEAQQQQQAEVGEEERATNEEQKNAMTKLQKPEPPPRPSRVGRPPLFSAASRYNGDEEAEEGQYRKPTQRRAGPLVLDNRHQLGSSSSSSEEEEQKNEWSDEDDDDDKEEEEERPWKNPFSRFDRTYGGGNRTAHHYLRPREGRNYRFYAGLIASQPDGDTIDNMHKRWFGNHSLLEYHHGFIQWLFPVFESGGVNWHAEPLSKHDAKLIRQDFTLATRVIKSYRLMLHFYGMRLASEETGEVERWPGIWKERYRNLDWNSHNNLRINRILTSLGELGFQRWKQPLVEHFTKEIIHNRLLPSCRYSLQSFWKETLNVDSSRFLFFCTFFFFFFCFSVP
ncbi:Opioid growth factor receptor [Balamuthia mandrillaris]